MFALYPLWISKLQRSPVSGQLQVAPTKQTTLLPEFHRTLPVIAACARPRVDLLGQHQWGELQATLPQLQGHRQGVLNQLTR